MIPSILGDSDKAVMIGRRLRGEDPPARSPGAPGRKLANIQTVQRAFSNQKAGHVEHLVSDGTSLWSYGWWEVARWVQTATGWYCVKRRGASFSMTTASKHANCVEARPLVLAEVETPRGNASMNL